MTGEKRIAPTDSDEPVARAFKGIFRDLIIQSPKRTSQALTGWDGFFPYYAGYPETFARSKSVVGDNVLVQVRPGAPAFARGAREGCRADAQRAKAGLWIARLRLGKPTFARGAREGCRAEAQRAKADRWPRASAWQAALLCAAAETAAA